MGIAAMRVGSGRKSFGPLCWGLILLLPVLQVEPVRLEVASVPRGTGALAGVISDDPVPVTTIDWNVGSVDGRRLWCKQRRTDVRGSVWWYCVVVVPCKNADESGLLCFVNTRVPAPSRMKQTGSFKNFSFDSMFLSKEIFAGYVRMTPTVGQRPASKGAASVSVGLASPSKVAASATEQNAVDGIFKSLFKKRDTITARTEISPNVFLGQCTSNEHGTTLARTVFTRVDDILYTYYEVEHKAVVMPEVQATTQPHPRSSPHPGDQPHHT